jgi:protein-disulfide isomerase
MVQTHTKEFPAERCTTMLDRYAEVVADLKKMEEANKPLDAAKQKAIAASDAPAFGPATAKVTLVEFADFQCPFSAKASRVVQAIKAKYGTQVRFVYRNYPLAFHNNARPAAEAALAAHAQGKFWEFHDKLFENQSSLDRAALEKYAQQIGLDMTLFRKALVTKQFASKVAADMKLGGQVAVQGTPTLYLNGRRVQNPTAEAEVFKLIDEALSGK